MGLTGVFWSSQTNPVSLSELAALREIWRTAANSNTIHLISKGWSTVCADPVVSGQSTRAHGRSIAEGTVLWKCR